MATPPLLFVVGPTAAGKEEVAFHLAERLGGEIVSMDSMKVYRGMDAGTSKPTPEARRRVPHHLLDVADPWEPFSVARWLREARSAVEAIRGHGRWPVIVGGTVLYLKAWVDGLFEGPGADWGLRELLLETAGREGPGELHARLRRIDPASAARLHPNDLRRVVRALEVHALTGRPISERQSQWGRAKPPLDGLIFGLRWDREVLNRRINSRVDRMIGERLVDEVRGLLAHPRGLGREARQALGYKEIADHLEGKAVLEEAVVEIKKRTRRFAKHQRSWLRRFDQIRWIDRSEEEPASRSAERILDRLACTETSG